MNQFILNPQENDLVYFPLKSNKPLKITKACYENYPVNVYLTNNSLFSCNLNGYLNSIDVNPSVFPYSKEWFDKLKHAYPNLEPYKEINYNEIMRKLLDMYGTVLSVGSDFSYNEAIEKLNIKGKSIITARTNMKSWAYLVPLNPYTFKPCKSVEEYQAFNNLKQTYSTKTIFSSPGGWGVYNVGIISFENKKDENDFRQLLNNSNFYSLGR